MTTLLRRLAAPYRTVRRTVGRDHILDRLPPHLRDLTARLADSANAALTKAGVPSPGVGPDDVCTVLAAAQALPLLYLTLTRTRHVHRVAEVVFTLLQPAVVSYGAVESAAASSPSTGASAAAGRVLPPWVVLGALWVAERTLGVRPCQATAYLLVKCLLCAVVFEPSGAGLDWAHNVLTVLGLVTSTASAEGRSRASSPAGSESSSAFSFVDVGPSASAASAAAAAADDAAEDNGVVLTIEDMEGSDWSVSAPLGEPYLAFDVLASGSEEKYVPPLQGSGQGAGRKVRSDVGVVGGDDEGGAAPDLAEEVEEVGGGSGSSERSEKEGSAPMSSSCAWPGQALSVPVSFMPPPPSSSEDEDEGGSGCGSTVPPRLLRVAAYDRQTIGTDVFVGVAYLPLSAGMLAGGEGSKRRSLVLRDGRNMSGEGGGEAPEVGTVTLSVRTC